MRVFDQTSKLSVLTCIKISDQIKTAKLCKKKVSWSILRAGKGRFMAMIMCLYNKIQTWLRRGVMGGPI